MSEPAAAEAMDRMYRHQRHIYDLTRKYYLLGRDRLIARLNPREGAHVLEIGCGTGRNLIRAARRYPTALLHGVDVSAEMLAFAARAVARAGVAERVIMARADATTLLASEVFGLPARIGYPAKLGGLVEEYHDPMYATGVGLVMFGGSREGHGGFDTSSSESTFTSVWERMRTWFKDFF